MLKHFGKKLHPPPLHDTNEIEVLLSTISCASPFSWCNAYIYVYICFYFVLANNKQMTEQRYILQTISDEHQKSSTMIFMSKSWEVITV